MKFAAVCGVTAHDDFDNDDDDDNIILPTDRSMQKQKLMQ